MVDRNPRSDGRRAISLKESEDLQDPVLWRYMNYDRLEHLIESSQLFFPTKYNYQDLLEGTFGQGYRGVPIEVALAQSVAPPPEGTGPHIEDEDDGLVWNRTAVQHRGVESIDLEDWYKRIGISCWCAREHEMVCLWSLYTGLSRGVAVKTTLSKFRSAVTPDLAEQIRVGSLEYVDPRFRIITESPFNALLYKSKWWNYEHEMRFMLEFDPGQGDKGCYVPVDLQQLIDVIVVSPVADRKFDKTLERTLERIGISPSRVITSEITGTVSRLPKTI